MPDHEVIIIVAIQGYCSFLSVPVCISVLCTLFVC